VPLVGPRHRLILDHLQLVEIPVLAQHQRSHGFRTAHCVILGGSLINPGCRVLPSQIR
jgi:hypothetical protein